MIHVRQYAESHDYEILTQWWRGQGCEEAYIPLPTYLPRSGFIAEEEGIMQAAAWLYCFIDVPAAQLGYLVANPANKGAGSARAVDAVLAHVNALADKMGVRMTARYDTDCGLLKRLQHHGWHELVDGQTEMIRFPERGGKEEEVA